MQTILFITAPIIYILIILFSAWVGIANSRQRKGLSGQSILAILTGLSTCPLVAVLIQFGRLEIPSIEIVLPLICATLVIGFFVGLTYIWSASLIFKDNSSAVRSLFVLGTIGGSTICLYFYFFHSQVQELLISSAWGFLFGVLMYTVLKGDIKNTFSPSAR